MLARAAACSLRLRYAELVASGALRTDAAQEAAVLRLSQLQAELRAHRAAVAEHAQALAAHAAAKEEQVQRLLREASHAQASGASAQASPQRGWFSGMLSTEPSRPAPPGRTELEAQALAAVGPPPPAPHAPRGLYLFGGVGVGKTLLMDLFYDAAANTVGASHARRVHFNAFANVIAEQALAGHARHARRAAGGAPAARPGAGACARADKRRSAHGGGFPFIAQHRWAFTAVL
jgi:predicted ATPase